MQQPSSHDLGELVASRTYNTASGASTVEIHRADASILIAAELIDDRPAVFGDALTVEGQRVTLHGANRTVAYDLGPLDTKHNAYPATRVG